MTVNLIKLSVGSETSDDLRDWQKRLIERRRQANLPLRPWHETRQFPKRANELVDGGSIYWVIKGVVQVRQTILEVNRCDDRNGKSYCELVLDPKLVPVRPVARKAFQGWRYLTMADAPPDLEGTDLLDLPAPLKAKLLEDGVW